MFFFVAPHLTEEKAEVTVDQAHRGYSIAEDGVGYGCHNPLYIRNKPDSQGHHSLTIGQQTGVYPYPLGAGSARPNPKMGAPETENPSCRGLTALRGGLRPWSQTMVSEGARPWGRSRSEFAELGTKLLHTLFLVLGGGELFSVIITGLITA